MNHPFVASNAYLIGISNYQNAGWKLNTPVSDAEALHRLLQADLGFLSKTLLDPTKEQLIEFFNLIQFENSTEDSRVLIYYAGHGYQKDSVSGLKGYFLPVDALPGNESSMVQMELLSGALRKIKSRHVLLILDCCFAGTFQMLNRRDAIGLFEFSHRLFRPHYEIFTGFPSRLVLSSTSFRQKAFDRIEDSDVNSPFNRFLCLGLSGEADYTHDRLVTASELKTYLTDNVSKITGYLGNLQSVGLDALDGDGEGEFLFFLDGFDATQLPEQAYVNPYKGLHSYEKADAALFFGRNRAIHDLLVKITEFPFVIVVGASGSGKSSLVKAGLLPGLERKNLKEKRIILIRPGEHPISALPPAADWDLLVIDQWEEVVTLAAKPKELENFNEEIRRLLESGKRIIGTIRTDFEAQARNEILEPFWTNGRFVVPAFTSEEYHDVIVQPNKCVACLFEDRDLVKTIEQEVVQQPSPLPLLSFMLSELFDLARQEPTRFPEIKRHHYEAVGGVSGALRNKADEVFNGLPDREYRETMRRLMLRLTTISAGEIAGRRLFLSELIYTSVEEDKRIKTVVQNLDKAKLICGDVDHEGRRFIEPAHGALVRAWRRLWDWVKLFGEENLLLHSKLRMAVIDFQSNQGNKDFLWTSDPRLEQITALIEKDPLLLNAVESKFIRESIAEKNRKVRQRRNELIFAFSILALLFSGAVFFAILSNIKMKEAEKNLTDFIRADSVRVAEETAKERLQFDRYLREGDTYMSSFDYDLALYCYQKADSIFLRFPNDRMLLQKVKGLRSKIEKIKMAGNVNKME